MNRNRDIESAAAWDLVRLRQQVREVREASFRHAWEVMAREHWPEEAPRQYPIEVFPWREQLQRSIDEMEARLPDFKRDEEVVLDGDQFDRYIGSEFEILAQMEILRGFVVPVREVPIFLKVTARMLAFIEIAGEKDLLDRHFEQGIHYHYALANRKRTTTMICWDTRLISDPSKKRPWNIRPIFHEMHGLGAKQKHARPDLWGDAKRQSIWKGCEPDLKRWPDIMAFRCASNKALPVWLTNSVLTPKALPPPPAGKHW
ncbi:MAG: hypothetical protein ACOH2L_13375 [Devosia sp.]